MDERRWRDPRTLRIWNVGVCPLATAPASGSGDDDTLVLCFESLATPRVAFSARCCPGVRARLASLDDQSLALCLDAAIAGGVLWVDPRDRQLWWVRADGRTGGSVRFVGCAEELQGTQALPAGRVDLGALMELRDRVAPRPAA